MKNMKVRLRNRILRGHAEFSGAVGASLFGAAKVIAIAGHSPVVLELCNFHGNSLQYFLNAPFRLQQVMPQPPPLGYPLWSDNAVLPYLKKNSGQSPGILNRDIGKEGEQF